MDSPRLTSFVGIDLVLHHFDVFVFKTVHLDINIKLGEVDLKVVDKFADLVNFTKRYHED